MLNPADRLAALRAELLRRGLDGFLVPRSDEHLGEYVPARADRLRWLTGFSGSAGLAVVLADVAAAFTDGRYVLQLAEQTDAALWQLRHITDEPPAAWLAQHAGAGARVGYDPLLFSEEAIARFSDKGVALVAVDNNPIDAVWQDQPGAPMAPALPHPLAFAGLDSTGKREQVAAVLVADKQDAAVVTDPASIAWLLNIRGDDVPFTPFALGFLVIHADAGCELFMAPEKVPAETRAWIGNAVSVQDRVALPGALARLRASGCGWMPGVRRLGSRRRCARRARRWWRGWTRARCRRRARTRWSGRDPGMPMPVMPSRCAGFCAGWRALPGGRVRCRRRRSCWRCVARWIVFAARVFRRSPVQGRTGRSSIIASVPRATARSSPMSCI